MRLVDQYSGIIDTAVPDEATHVGFVFQDWKGQVMITKLDHAPDGVSATFPKIRRTAKEKAHVTLQRCIEKMVGRMPSSIYPIPFAWAAPGSLGFYFTGLADIESVEFSDKPPNVWVTSANARKLLAASKNAVSRHRDIGLLSTARAISVDPCRRVMLMAQELHKKGYQRLRPCPYVYSLGTWRCPIVPAEWTAADHGCAIDEDNPAFKSEQGVQPFWYTSANGQNVFDEIVSSVFASPRDLAEIFLWRHPALAQLGHGEDPAFAAWLSNVIASSAPHDVIIAYDLNIPGGYEPWDYVKVTNQAETKLSLPPLKSRSVT